MDVDISRVRSLQEKETSNFYRQRAENESRVAKLADAIKRYPDIGEKLEIEDPQNFSYQTAVPEAYKPVVEIDKSVLRDQTNALQAIIVKYNKIVTEEYERAVELQAKADEIVGIGV